MEINMDRIAEQGEQVFFHRWDTGPSGSGTGTEVVYRVGDEYLAFMSWGGKPIGPFGSLWDAVRDIGLESVNRATVEVGCSELGAGELAARLKTKEEPGLSILINGEAWVVAEDGGFVPGT
jgi:hypothetical protein